MKKGEITGLSMAGLAEVEAIEKTYEPKGFFGRALETMAGLFRKDFKSQLSVNELSGAISLCRLRCGASWKIRI